MVEKLKEQCPYAHASNSLSASVASCIIIFRTSSDRGTKRARKGKGRRMKPPMNASVAGSAALPVSSRIGKISNAHKILQSNKGQGPVSESSLDK